MTQPIPPGTPDLGDVPALVEQANLGPAPKSALHILVVTPDERDPLEPDFYEYAVECPGVTNGCRMYEDCLASQEEIDALDDLADNEQPTIAHGVRHLHINSMWMAATDRCYVRDNDGLPDAVAGYFRPGRHSIDWDDNDGLEIHAIPEAGTR